MANKLVTSLAGGINVKAAPLIIKDSEAELVLNYNLDTVGALTKRYGYTTHANAPAAVNINGLYQFVKIGAGTPNIQLMVQNNTGGTQGVVYWRSSVSGNWAAALSTDTASRKTRFTTLAGYVIRVNGADAPSSSTNVSTWGTTNLGDRLTGTVLTITPRYASTFQDRAYLANGNTAITSSRLWFSSLPSTIDALNGNVAAGATTITVDSTTGFVNPGGNGTATIVIEGDVINYTGTTATTFTGCTGVDSAHPDNAFVYQYVGGTAQELSWDTSRDYVDINPDDGDEITGLENNGNRLLIFKNNATYRWTFGQVEADRLIGVGTSSQESVKTNFDKGITFFAGIKGVYAYTGGRPKNISRKIQRYIDAVSDWTEVYGAVDEDHYYLSVGNLTVTVAGVSRTISNAVLVYHISLDAWTIYSLANAARFFALLRDSTDGIDEDLYFGSTNGQVYQFLDSTATGDNATAIPGEFLGKEHMLSFPGFSQVSYVDVIASQHTNSSVFYRADKKVDPKSIGNLTGRVTNLKVGGDDVRTIQLRIVDNSTTRSIIEGYNIEYDSTPRRT